MMHDCPHCPCDDLKEIPGVDEPDVDNFGSSFDITKYPFNPALAAKTFYEYYSNGLNPLDEMPDLTRESLAQMVSCLIDIADDMDDEIDGSLYMELERKAFRWFR